MHITQSGGNNTMTRNQAKKNLAEDLQRAKEDQGNVGPLNARQIPTVDFSHDDELGLIIKLDTNRSSSHPDDDGSCFF